MFRVVNFLKSLWANKKTTAAGAVTLATTAATCYGMANGVVPITPETVGMAATGFSSGVGLLLARDSKITSVLEKEAPKIISAVEQVEQLKKEAEAGQKKIDEYIAVTNAINQVINKTD